MFISNGLKRALCASTLSLWRRTQLEAQQRTLIFLSPFSLTLSYVAHPFFENERLIGMVKPEEQSGGFTYFDVEPVEKSTVDSATLGVDYLAL